tara:strand:+ start:4171 stop:5871 length:1701 start_codon:yes stop_codon:yes gene_type:complete
MLLTKQILTAYINFLKQSQYNTDKQTVFALHTLCKTIQKRYKTHKPWHPKKNIMLDSSNHCAKIYTKWANGKQYMANVGFSLLEPYQTQALWWLLVREFHPEHKNGAILGDDMGLGKTIQSLAFIASGRILTKYPNLVIVPAGLISQWEDIIKKIFPTRKLYIHHGDDRLTSSKKIKKLRAFIILTTHNLIYKRNSLSKKKIYIPSILHKINWNHIIIDESHLMRNTKSLKTKGAFNLKANFKLALTGTPIQNCIEDIFTQFKIVGINTHHANFKEIKGKYLLRRTKLQLEKTHPKLKIKKPIFHNKVIDFNTKEEREFYNQVKLNIGDSFKNLSKGLDRRKQMVIMFELLLRLRQSTISPQLVLNGYEKKGLIDNTNWEDGLSTKYKTILEDLKQLDPSDKAIVFTHFNNDILTLNKSLKKLNITTKVINGDTQYSERNITNSTSYKPSIFQVWLLNKVAKVNLLQPIHTLINDYIKPPTILLIQIKAGAVGLNLQMYNKVFFLSPDWNPANEMQAIARAYRIGQQKQVEVTRYIIKKTIDTYIMNTQYKKMEIINTNITTTTIN